MPPIRDRVAPFSALILTLLLVPSLRAQTPAKSAAPKPPTPSAKATKAAPAKPAKPAEPAEPAEPTTPASSAGSDHLAAHVRLTDGHTAITRTRKELGFTLKSEKPVAFTVDLGTLKAALTRIAPTFDRKMEEPRPIDQHGAATIFPGHDGQALNVPATAQAIAAAVAKDPATMRFDATVEKRAPTKPASRYKGIDAVLATFSTRTNANSKRNHNVELGASRINGLLLAPKDTFSLNKTVGERLQSSGFRTAPVFVNAREEAGIGGGVSQVTGTLFNAAARAGLKILEVNPHSRPVAYLPVGYDATVAYGDEDLRFANNTDYPVYLDYHFDNKTRRLTATIFGHKVPGRTIRLKAEVQHLAPGKIDAQLYRITKMNGKATKERLFTHHYRWDPSTKA